MLGLRFCARAFSSCGKRGPLFIAVRGPLTIAASLVAEHGLQTHRLSSCGSRAQLLRGMWDLPRPGLESVSPALAGRFSTTAPPGKPLVEDLDGTQHSSTLPIPKATPPPLSPGVPSPMRSLLTCPASQKSISHMVSREQLKPKSKLFVNNISDKVLISRL